MAVSDSRAAAARDHHRAAADAGRVADQHRRQRDRLILQLRAEDPRRWTYLALARAVGCSPELIAHVVRTSAL
jgi:AraC-like DNA-binding protein